MTRAVDCETVQAELAAQTLVTFTMRWPAEIERHLAQCDLCRAFLAQCRAVGDQLLSALAPVTPPAGAKARLMAELQRAEVEPQLTNRPRPEPEPASERRERRGRMGSGPAWAGVAALLGAAIVGAAGGAAWQQARLAHVSALNRALAAQMSERTALLSAPERETVFAVNLAPTTLAPAAAGKAACFEVDGDYIVVLDVHDLPALSGSEAYQAWLVKDGVRTDAGILEMAGGGSGFLLFRYAAGEFDFNAIGITREPDAQGHQPRGKKVLGASLASSSG